MPWQQLSVLYIAFPNQYLDRAVAGAGLDDPVAAGVQHLDDVDRNPLPGDADEFRPEFDEFPEDVQDEILAHARLIEKFGPG